MAAARLTNAALALASVVVSLFVGEVALRAVVQLPARRVLPEVRYEAHPVRRFTLRPGQTGYSYGARVTVDERGFRMNGPDRAPGAQTAVFALGDSFTFGMGVRDEETWPARLEARLQEQAGPSLRVTNGGTISYGVFQEMDLLRSAGLATRPRVVVHALYWNDFMNPEPPSGDAPPVVTPQGYFVWDSFDQERGWLSRGLSWGFSRSALLFSVRQASRQMVGRQTGDAAYGRAYARFLERGLADEEWTTIERFYGELQTLAQDHAFGTFVIIVPVSDVVGRPGAEAHAYPAAARSRLEVMGIPYIDGFALWSKRGYGRRYFLTDGPDAHLDARGYAIIADAAASALQAHPALGAAILGRSATAP